MSEGGNMGRKSPVGATLVVARGRIRPPTEGRHKASPYSHAEQDSTDGD